MAVSSLIEDPLTEHDSSMAKSGAIKTVFCTSGGVLGATVLQVLLRDPGFKIVGLVRSNRVFRAEFGFLRGAACFFYRCGVLYTVYIWLITTAAEFLGSILSSEKISVGTAASNRDIPQLITRDVNSKEGRHFLSSLGPDLMVAAHFDQKLDPDLCDGQAHAAVNLHPSLLPKHRGVEPLVQSMLSNESEAGITLHRLSEQIDRGKILNFKREVKGVEKSVFSLGCSLMESGASLLVSSKSELLDRNSGTQQEEGGSYESWPTARDIVTLYSKGGALIRIQDLPRLFGFGCR